MIPQPVRPTVYARDLHLAENLSPEQESLRDALVKLDRATESDGYEYTETVSTLEYVSGEFTEVARAFAALLNAETSVRPEAEVKAEALDEAVRYLDYLLSAGPSSPDSGYVKQGRDLLRLLTERANKIRSEA